MPRRRGARLGGCGRVGARGGRRRLAPRCAWDRKARVRTIGGQRKEQFHQITRIPTEHPPFLKENTPAMHRPRADRPAPRPPRAAAGKRTPATARGGTRRRKTAAAAGGRRVAPTPPRWFAACASHRQVTLLRLSPPASPLFLLLPRLDVRCVAGGAGRGGEVDRPPPPPPTCAGPSAPAATALGHAPPFPTPPDGARAWHWRGRGVGGGVVLAAVATDWLLPCS